MAGDTEYTKVAFNEIFKKQLNGGLFLKKCLVIGGEEFGPGLEIKKGELLSGVDFYKRQGLDLAVTPTEDPDKFVLIGFYADNE
jgi:hypothetical protein